MALNDDKFAVDRADLGFMDLLDEYNRAAQDLQFSDDFTRIDLAAQALFDYGAWVDDEDCWRSPDAKKSAGLLKDGKDYLGDHV